MVFLEICGLSRRDIMAIATGYLRETNNFRKKLVARKIMLASRAVLLRVGTLSFDLPAGSKASEIHIRI
jgi:hypothetical protein